MTWEIALRWLVIIVILIVLFSNAWHGNDHD